MINRGSVIVRPKQPYIDWAAQLDGSDMLPDNGYDATVYLIPEYGDDIEAMEALSRCFDIIFEVELEGWHTDKTTWPKNRTFSLFREWFSFEFYSVVEDLCGYDITDDNYG